MKRSERYNNNKGAALISVMIAVTFITIVASALLYMAYMNFTMKTVSVKSKANFYETEGYLQGVTVKLQDNVANMSSGTSTYLATFKDGANNYDCKKLLGLKYPSVLADSTATAASASVEIDGDIITLKRGTGAEYSVAPMNGDPNSKTKVHTFKGVTIEQKTPEGLTNNIKTNIIYYVTEETTSADAGGVGEFSMMADGSLTGSSNAYGFSFMTLYGNSFLSDAQYSDTLQKTIPGPGAIVMNGSDKINIAGKYCVVYGDMVLNDNSCFTVTSGNLCVYGNIYLNGNSTLICSGKIYMLKEAIPEYGIDNVPAIIASDGVENHVYPSDLASNIQEISVANFNSFVGELKYNDNKTENDGFLYQILDKDPTTLELRGLKLKEDVYVQYDEFTNDSVKCSPIEKYGRKYGWQIFKDGSGNASDFDNMLTFVIVQPLQVKDTSVNSTIISKFPVTYEQAHGSALKKIGPEAFRQLLKKSTDSTCDTTATKSFNYNGENYNNVMMSAGDFFDAECDKTVNRILGYAVNGEGGGTPVVLSSLKFENWVKDSED